MLALREQPERVHEVALRASGIQWRGVNRPSFYDAVALAGPDRTYGAWDLRAKVTDVAARAKRWEELRSQSGDWIRVLDGEAIVQLPITAHDPTVLEACAGDWADSTLLVGRILGHADNPIGLSLVTWRIRQLLRVGALEGRGESRRFGLPSEVRPAPASE